MVIRGKSASHIRKRLRSFFSAKGFNQTAWYLLFADGKTTPLHKVFTQHGLSTIWKKFSRGLPALLCSRIDNAEIRIKSNARVSYFDPKYGKHLTAKIALGSRHRKESLAREIKARHILQRIAPDLPLPHIVDYDKRGLRWIIEERIDGQPSQKTQRIEPFLRNVADKLYKPALKSQPVAVWLRRRGIAMPELHEILREFDLVVEHDVSAPAETWPVAFLHGDLSPGNMIMGRDGRIRLVDWEKFGPGPVAWDLRKLLPLAPALSEQLLSSLNPPGDMKPLQQIQIVLAAELLRRRRTRQESKRYLMSILGNSASEAEMIAAARVRQLSDTLALTSGKSPPRV
jgi:hypothetical protein